MIIRSLIATTIAAIVTAGFVLAIGLTVSPAAPIKFDDIAKSDDEYGHRITLAKIVACDCAHSNIESRSTRTGAGAVAPHAGIRCLSSSEENNGWHQIERSGVSHLPAQLFVKWQHINITT